MRKKINNKTKRIYSGCLAILILLLSGCAASEDLTNQAQEDAHTTTVQEESADAAEAADTQQTHLELVSLTEEAPYYSVSFHKVEGGTGALLAFEGSATADSPDETGPYLSMEPEDALQDISYSFAGEEEETDTVAVGFWNRGEAEVVTVTLDDLEYQLELPQPEYEEKTLEQQLDFADFDAKLEKIRVYPQALLLNFSEVDDAEWERIFLLADSADAEDALAPKAQSYGETDGTLELLFVLEGAPETEYTLLVGKNLYSEEGEYDTCTLSLE